MVARRPAAATATGPGPGRHSPLVPNLLLAGVTHANASLLTGALADHPQIAMPSVRRIDHFTPLRYGRSVDAPLEDYDDHFAGWRGERYRLESSPVYFDGGTALVRAVERGLDPQTRIVLVLRDPAERLWTSYTDKMTRGRLPRAMTYDTFVDRCLALRANGTDRYEGNRYFRTLSGGFYRDHLPAWLSAFGSRARTVFAEDLARHPEPVVADLLRWLDLDPDAVPGLEPRPERGRGPGQRTEQGQGPGSSRSAAHPDVDRRPQPDQGSRSAFGSLMASVRPALQRASGRLAVPDADGLVIARPHERTRCRVRELYAEANRDLAVLLSGRGHRELPSWLTTA